MSVSSTEVQNNFGKYLMLATREDIIITRNGIEIARLQSVEAAPKPTLRESTVKETADPCDLKVRKASYEEFLALTHDEENRYEYIDGEFYLLASPKTAHQCCSVNFFNTFQGRDCTPFVALYDIYLQKRHRDESNVVQPDLMVICDLDEHLDEREPLMLQLLTM